ncbi:DUF1799 domain-containing protein [Propionivibrio sp.]|uniref:DUF1799 domain-containing protein n=1 Tax=Propionivibrio sp. TaxID=2212460 RepID=UPI003BF2FD7A
MQAALAAFGASAEAIAAAIEHGRCAPCPYALWPENEAPMNVLIAMRKQLRRSGMDGRVDGLDYAVLPWVMQQLGIAPEATASVFEALQWAEDEMVACLNT